MDNMAKFTFGKHNGLTVQDVFDAEPSYIRWARTTDIMDRHPDLADDIIRVLSVHTPVAVELIDSELPDTTIRVRGGGKMHDGIKPEVLQLDGTVSTKGITRDDNLSGSGMSGYYTLTIPGHKDMVVLFTETSGSVNNQNREHQWMARRNDQWYRISPNNKAAAMSQLKMMKGYDIQPLKVNYHSVDHVADCCFLVEGFPYVLSCTGLDGACNVSLMHNDQVIDERKQEYKILFEQLNVMAIDLLQIELDSDQLQSINFSTLLADK